MSSVTPGNLTFSQMQPQKRTPDQVAAEYQAIRDEFGAAAGPAGREAAVRKWDALRRAIGTWKSLVGVRFRQDTADEEARAAHKEFLEVEPKFAQFDDAMKSFLLASEHRSELVAAFGEQPFSLWEVDVTVRKPETEDDERKESDLVTEYTELTGSIEVEFAGEKLTPSQMQLYLTDDNRAVRRDAHVALWNEYAKCGEQLDRIYDDLVEVRHRIGTKLGRDSFTDIGYRRMQRTDYDAGDVATFREEVLEQIVPLATELIARQTKDLGLDPGELSYWDEPVQSLTGNAKLVGDGPKWLEDTTTEMFSQMGSAFSAFWTMMQERELLDLPARSGKAAGAFVTDLSHFGVPFMFCNSAGVRADVKTLAHESGHAFQVSNSTHFPLVDSWWPTSEGGEIHSMSLEFLSWPHMELYFGDDADKYRRQHLTESLLFLPYGVAVDYFQERVYEKPGMSAAERKAVWTEVEAMCLPWRQYHDVPLAKDGGVWQRQIHIYCFPFYYIDYTLALTCALQMWLKSEENYDSALERYVALCKRGGSLPFRALVESTGLVSPFQSGCLTNVASQARAVLEL